MIYDFNLSANIDQCDIFQPMPFSCESNNEFYSILLTPRCDLVLQDLRSKPKANYLKLAGIIDCKAIINNILSQLKITKAQKNGAEYIDNITYNDLIILLKNFINGNIYPRYYYLPPLDGYFNHSVIDFQLVETIKYSPELVKMLALKRISKVKSSWRESIPVRYSSYFSRIGVDDISDAIIEKLFIDYSLNFIKSS